MPKLNVNQIDKYLNSKDNGDKRRSKPHKMFEKDNNQNYSEKE